MVRSRKVKGSSWTMLGNTEHWQRQARRMWSDGLKIVRSHLTEAETFAEQTVGVAKLQLTVGRNQLNRFKVLYDLGKAVWDSFPTDEHSQVLSLNDKIRRIAHRVRNLDEESDRAQRVISAFPKFPKGGVTHTSHVSRGSQRPHRTPSSRSGGDTPIAL